MAHCSSGLRAHISCTDSGVGVTSGNTDGAIFSPCCRTILTSGVANGNIGESEIGTAGAASVLGFQESSEPWLVCIMGVGDDSDVARVAVDWGVAVSTGAGVDVGISDEQPKNHMMTPRSASTLQSLTESRSRFTIQISFLC